LGEKNINEGSSQIVAVVILNQPDSWYTGSVEEKTQNNWKSKRNRVQPTLATR